MRPTLRYLTAAVAMLSLAACSDTTAPKTASTRSIAPVNGPAFDYGGDNHVFGQQSTDFTVKPTGGHVSVNGLFDLDFPAGAVSQTTTFHAVVRVTFGGAAIDFTPHMVFGQPVTLSTMMFSNLLRSNSSYFASHPWTLNPLAMFYVDGLNSTPVNDFAGNSSLITHVNLKTGAVWRTILHFSGYLMGGGECTPSPDNPDCIQVDGI